MDIIHLLISRDIMDIIHLLISREMFILLSERRESCVYLYLFFL